MSGNVAIVGAWAAEDNGTVTGAAYIFAKDHGGPDNWGEVKKLVASDGAAFDIFGFSVSISGDVAVVGAYDNDDNGSASGSAYIFARDQGGTDNWGEVKKLLPSDGAANDRFGDSVSLSGDVAVVGAYQDDDNGNDSGSAYVFAKDQGGTDNWGEVEKLVASDGAANDSFGRLVSVSGDVVVVGAYQDDDNGSNSGSAYVFAKDQGGTDNWGEVEKLLPSDGAANDYFGTGVSTSGSLTIVGANGDDDNGSDSGSAYVFEQQSRPDASDDSATTDEDTAVAIDVLANDSDPDADPLTVDSVTQPSNGSVTNNSSDVTYTPDADFNGSDSFEYTVSDGNGGTATATVSITVDPANDVPVASNDSASTDEDTAVTVDVLGNDTDVDGDTLTVDMVTQPSNGTVTNNSSDVTYTPNADFNGNDSFDYTVTDGNGGTATTTVSITVDPVNDRPVASDDGPTTDEDVAVTVDVLGNDSDVDGDTLTVDSVTQPSNGTITNNSSDVTYTPDADFNGSDSFDYTVSDGNGGTDTATVSITVDPVNDAPVANDDSASTDEDAPVAVDVLGNDSDVDGDTLTVDSVTQPSNGTVINNSSDVAYTPDADFNGSDSFDYTVTDGNSGTATATVSVTVDPVNDAPLASDDSSTTDEGVAVTVDVLGNDTDVDGDTLTVDSVTQPSNGTITNNSSDVTYTPDADFNGSDSFDYTVSDGNGGTATATVSISVDPVNDAPVASDDSASTDEDAPVTIDVLGNDTDVDGDTLTVDSVTQPSNGTITNNSSDVTYTPDADFNGSDSFDYTVTDGNGGTATATVLISVDPVNDAPVASDDSASTDEDTPVTIDVLGNDTDVDGDTLTVDSVTQPSNGTVTNNSSDVTYTPDASFNGSDSFDYTVTDGNGDTTTATVSIAVVAVNNAPVASDDTASTEEGTSVTVDVLANDSDPDGESLTVDNVTQPSNGTVTNNSSDVTYTPDTGFNGSDSFDYTVSDGNGDTHTATVTITVEPIDTGGDITEVDAGDDVGSSSSSRTEGCGCTAGRGTSNAAGGMLFLVGLLVIRLRRTRH